VITFKLHQNRGIVYLVLSITRVLKNRLESFRTRVLKEKIKEKEKKEKKSK